MEPEEELRRAIREKRAVLVAGTGVSMAASRDPATGKPHPQASWAGLLENGLDWLEEQELISANKAQAHRSLLREDAETHHFISAAQDVTKRMGGPQSVHFEEWLGRTVGKIQAHDHALLDELEALRCHGNLLATTNYDSLLLRPPGSLQPVTWDDPDFLRAVRQRESDKVLFLHGHWRRPASVVLDWSSYERIANTESYRDDLRSFWQVWTWVYVGCGVSGLRDPDLGLLLKQYGKRHRDADLWDFCLVRQDLREEFQADFDERQVNVRAVSFGTSHEDLPAFLHSLLPSSPVVPVLPAAPRRKTLPAPPAFLAEPDFIGSHAFVGRTSQLAELDDWAKPADPTNLLLFEAIGGTGKSLLTWEWVRNRAPAVRSDWAGRFWYSFYERGAVMADFCRHGLAYMTEQPREAFEKVPARELARQLLAELHARPWLLVLDGLERVLVAYHRIDAAEVPDEEANAPTDKVLDRNPCDAIRDEDGDLLRQLAGARPSKILVSSRLTPRVWLNPSGLPVAGAKRITLPGLRPADAEALLRSCGVAGDSEAIQRYLTENCDNHPLVIGVLAGLIANYLPDRGNFDAWAADRSQEGGARLNLAELDLIQRRNHILRAAIGALEPKSRELLSTLALLSTSVDYETLAAFNPHLPPKPDEVEEPEPPEEHWRWSWMGEEEKNQVRKEYDAEAERRRVYEAAEAAWRASKEVRQAPGKLAATVKNLEQRGLLQYDAASKRHDLHPVVRGVAAGDLAEAERDRHGQRVVDHFSAVPHDPWEQAKTLEDLAPGLHVVRTLLKLGRLQAAADALRGDLAHALLFSLEDHAEVLAVLRPFFPTGWLELPQGVDPGVASFLANEAALAFDWLGEHETALALFGVALRVNLDREALRELGAILSNIATCLSDLNRPSEGARLLEMNLRLAEAVGDEERLFRHRLDLFRSQNVFGQWPAARETWGQLDGLGRTWSRAVYRQGDAEKTFARSQFWQGQLREEHLARATQFAEKDNNRAALRDLLGLRGEWQLEQGLWAPAAEAFSEAVYLARERRLLDGGSEAGLALAKWHLGQLGTAEEARQEAERLAGQRKTHHRYLARLWQELGDGERAAEHALKEYRWAWADGEPYVRRYDLTRATELLQELNVAIPELPAYDPSRSVPFPWEAEVEAAIERLRAEKES